MEAAALILPHSSKFCLVESPRGTSPRGAHRTGRERLRSSGSSYPVLLTLSGSRKSSCSQLLSRSKTDRATPSLQPHYIAFFTTTGCSVPVPRFGTQILVALPLVSLPLHQGDRFPRSTKEPEPHSRRPLPPPRRGKTVLIWKGSALPIPQGRRMSREATNPRKIPNGGL
jgi:hypothetical protein